MLTPQEVADRKTFSRWFRAASCGALIGIGNVARSLVARNTPK